jgi:hypothetical protein
VTELQRETMFELDDKSMACNPENRTTELEAVIALGFILTIGLAAY